MKISITVHANDTYEASLIINALKQVRSIELDTFLAGKQPEQHFNHQPGRESGTGDSTEKADNDFKEDSHPATRPNIDPGYEACSRIGSDTKTLLLKELPGRSNDPEHIGKKIKRSTEQTKQLIGLLWARGEIKFDGKDFYL